MLLAGDRRFVKSCASVRGKRPVAVCYAGARTLDLYCGHLGSANPNWWPNRGGLSLAACEFEAESVSYLVCSRLGIETRSAQYLADYVQQERPRLASTVNTRKDLGVEKKEVRTLN